MARRVVSLFVVCALLPVSALALVSYIHIRNQLYDQSRKRLREVNKAVTVSIYERLLFLNSDLHTVISLLQPGIEASGAFKREASQELIKNRFKSVTLVPQPWRQSPTHVLKSLPDLNQAQKDHLESGSPLLLIDSSSKKSAQMHIVLKIPFGKAKGRMLVSEIETDYLWEAFDRLPPEFEIYVLTATGEVLYSSIPKKIDLICRKIQDEADKHTGLFEWTYDDRSYLSSYSSVFLRSNFFYPKLTVILSEPKELIFAPIGSFKYTFSLVIIVTLALVFLLSLILIQKNLVPIELLREGTRKIADGAFGHRVKIISNDEFETLGDSFNRMSEKIRETQDLLARSARMATMGQMASGFLHEINQPLTGIYGHIQILELDENLTERHQERLQSMLKAIERMTGMMDQFRSIGYTSKTKFGLISLKESVYSIRNLFEHQMRTNNIRCSIEIQEGIPAILGDENGVQQIISNLMINAIHALEGKEDGGRDILIKIQHRDGTVILDFEDNGCGMPQDVQAQIFDPFFTTKASKKGSGLGMTIVETIVHQHEATIKLESNVGVGTRFSIEFPVAR